MMALSRVIPPLNGVAPPMSGIDDGVEAARLKLNNSGRLLMIHTVELSGLINICCGVNGPAPRSKLAIELEAVVGQLAETVPVVTTSTAGESAATAPVPLGMAL